MKAASLLIIQPVSGINAVTGFLENIFLATGSSIPPQIATTLIGVIQVFTVFITSSLIDKLGRKMLLLSSALGLAVSLTLLGLYFFLSKHQFAFVTYIWWLPIVSLIFYIICFNYGVGPVSWTMVSELFPSNVKSSATAMVSATNFGVSFQITIAFPLISEMLGMAQSFWLFGVCCILGAVFILLIVPETKGKTAAEIQQMLNK
ncbi:facilitated trehalose transporter Tret1-like [Sitophilus oryzae]|uniref:Facilitated trehalose transporter Tret1-like n=1 Tax=Sitophilus oryzae TaxID=7048 RepID=A0A6J2XTP5_SITOR|nr:facilitated trehalose transporter Tret1-like [Sitophilus oryzae]